MKKNTCCKCGEPSRGNNQGYCNPCHAAYQRENRPAYSELTREQKVKDCARSYINVYIQRGHVIKQPCSKCGNTVAQAHHEDYSKPLEVTWLCKNCHLELHKVARETLKRKKQLSVA